MDAENKTAVRQYNPTNRPQNSLLLQRQNNMDILIKNRLKIASRLQESLIGLSHCKNNCWRGDVIDEDDIRNKITNYIQMANQSERSQWLHQAVSSVGDDGLYNIGLPTKKRVCGSCFHYCSGVPRATFYQSKNRAEVHGRKNTIRRTGSGRPNAYMELVVQWLLAYALLNGEQMPHLEEVHLNAYSWLEVHKKIVIEVAPLADMSYSAFMTCRKVGCKELKVRKYSEFAKCPICTEMKDEISKNTGLRRIALQEDYASHLRWQEAEKKEKRKHILKCLRQTGRKYCLIDIDGRDKHKTNIGKRVEEDKDTDKAMKLGCGVEGAQVYFNGVMKTYAYTQYARFPSGSDGIMNVLLDCITRSGVGIDGAFPDTLYLYYDNCSRENKNKYMLGLLHYLVHIGCFKKIKLCFLPVGHTHDRVDRFFRIINSHIKLLNIMSLKDLIFGIKKCNLKDEKRVAAPAVECIHIDHQGCYTAAMAPYLEKDSKIKGITGPRCFIIKRGVDGIVQHWYRNQLQTSKKQGLLGDNLWMPYNEAPFQMFPREFPPHENMLSPSSVPPVPIDIPALRESIKLWYTKSYIGEETYSDHNALLHTFATEDRVTCEDCKAFRHTMAKNGKSVHHDAKEATRHSSLYNHAYTAMKKHMQDNMRDHPRYIAQIPFPHNHYPWDYLNRRYQSTEERIIMEPMTVHQHELHRRIISLQVEGQHVHAVGNGAKAPKKKGTDAQDKMDPGNKSITAKMYAICRDVTKKNSWFVIYIESCIMKNIIADLGLGNNDELAKPKVWKVRYRELASSNADGTGPFLFRWAKWGQDKDKKECGIVNQWVKKPRATAPTKGFTQEYLAAANIHINPIKVAWAEGLIKWDADVYKLLTRNHQVRDDVKKYVEKVLLRREKDNEPDHELPSDEIQDGEYEENDVSQLQAKKRKRRSK